MFFLIFEVKELAHGVSIIFNVSHSIRKSLNFNMLVCAGCLCMQFGLLSTLLTYDKSKA